MKKTAQVIIIPTERASVLIKNISINTLSFGKEITKEFVRYGEEAQHLYILSDEEIKEGDWIIATDNNEGYFLHQVTPISIDNIKVKDKKIIATTNPELHQQDIFAVGNECCKLRQDFIEAYVKEYNAGNVIKEIMVEYQDIDVMEDGEELLRLKLRPDNTIIIYQDKTSKTYSESEVDNLLTKLHDDLSDTLASEFINLRKWKQDNL